MKLDVLDIQGQKTGRQINLPDEIFGAESNDHVIYLAAKAAQANRRQGTHASKERNAVKGSTKKIKKQKGTGTARAGDIKNPLFRGGGKIFGPSPRSYHQKVNKKTKKIARNAVLSGKVKAEKVVALEDFSFDKPNTREFRTVIKNLDLDGRKTLVLLSDYDQNLYLSSRNLPKCKVLNIKDAGILDFMESDTIVLSEGCEKHFNQLV
ncbi:MAG: 50S ribosomal protein L4 [Saprospirales bacterium]|nr:MAG: 50S ribosomal protein L4 [Saprospirales bacterium]